MSQAALDGGHMWSPAQQPCTVTVALLPWPRTVTLQEAGGTAQNWGARLLWERSHLPSRDPEGGSGRPLHQLVWSEDLPPWGRALVRESQLPVAIVCGWKPALLVWSVVGEGDSTVCCEVEAWVLLGGRFYP